MSAVFNKDHLRPGKYRLLHVGSNANTTAAADACADRGFGEEVELITPILENFALATFLEADTTPLSGVLLEYFYILG